jgi:hypothetical protein
MKTFPTKSNCFEETNWRDRREQATPILSKILDELSKKATWKQQQIFLSKCRDKGVTPKGLRVSIPKKIMDKEHELRLKLKCERELIQKTIKRLHIKQQNSDEKIAGFKLDLKGKLKMSRTRIENTLQWLNKKAQTKALEKKKTLRKKFQQLNEEKKQFEKELHDFMMENKNTNLNVNKKVVYNNSSKELSQKQIELLALGLNFAITPKKFPLIEYITAAEKLCQSIEQIGDDESIEKAQQIRNSVLNQIRKGVGMKIKSNLNAEEHKLIKEITEDQTIIICPADKGKAIVIEDRKTYLSICKTR